MTFYTPDGIRHHTEEEALEHAKTYLITQLNPVDDKMVQAIHAHDWKSYDVQCTPQSYPNSLYLELAESSKSESGEANGFKLLKYSKENTHNTSEEEIIKNIENRKTFLNMVDSEIRNLLDEISKDDNYFYEEESHDVVVEFAVHEGNDILDDEINYTIDGFFEGTIIWEDDGDNLEAVMKSVESQFIKEVEGEYNTAQDKINGIDFFKVIDNAALAGRRVRLTVLETEVDTQGEEEA